MSAVLGIAGVSKSYGEFAALTDVTIDVSGKEAVAIVGPNGAGKSTLFAVIGGQLEPTVGQVTLHGDDVTGLKPERRVSRGLARTFQTARLFDPFTVQENCIFAFAMRSKRRWLLRNLFRDRPAREVARSVLDQVGLGHRRDASISSLTQGERKRLELAMALAQSAEVLLLDEPSAGMGSEETRGLIELLGRLRSVGDAPALLFSSHDMDVVSTLAERVVFMSQGKVVMMGTPEEVTHDERVRTLYLGNRG